MSYFDQTRVTNAAGAAINPVQDETVVLLRRIAKLLESNAVTDANQRQRVIVEQATAANLNVTIASALLAAGTANVGQVVVGFGGQATAAANIIDSRFQLIDIARNSYANGIRSKLTWS